MRSEPARGSLTPLTRRLFGESAVYGLATAGTSLVNLALLPVFTHTLAPSEYGVLALVVALTSLCVLFSIFGLDNAMARWFYEPDADNRAVFATGVAVQLLVATTLALLLVIFARPIASTALGAPGASTAVRAVGPLCVAQVINLFAFGWLRLHRLAGRAAAFAVALALATGGATMLALRSDHPTVSRIVLYQAVGQGVFALGTAFGLRHWLSPARIQPKLLLTLIVFALPLVPAGVASWALNLLDRYLLRAFSTSADVGIYQLGYQLSTAVALVTTAFQQAWAPFALSIQHRPDARDFYARVLPLFLLVGGAVAILTSALSFELVPLLGAAYQDAAYLVPLLAFSHVFVGLTYVAALGLTITGCSAPIGRALIGGAVLNVVLNVALIPPLGRYGAALATVLAWATVGPWIYRSAQRVYRIPVQPQKAIVVAVTTIGLAYAVVGLHYLAVQFRMLGYAAILIVLSRLVAYAADVRGSPAESD